MTDFGILQASRMLLGCGLYAYYVFRFCILRVPISDDHLQREFLISDHSILVVISSSRESEGQVDLFRLKDRRI